MSLSRRDFFKTAGLMTAATGIVGIASYTDWLQPVEQARADEAEETTAYTFHQWHCGGNCSLKCTVRDGRLVQVEPNKWDGEDRFNTICLKGISEVQHIYGDTRIQTPLKRVGERGSGQFESISWDEAFEECASQIKAVQEKYGDAGIMFDTCLEPCVGFVFIADFLKGQLQGEDIEGVDVGIGNGFDPSLGRYDNEEMLATNTMADWTKTKTIIHLGTNILESNLVYDRWFFDAKEAGAKMWCVDPNFSTTASKCDEWMPIQPGTDSALLLGMITLILDNGWYDEDFVTNHTDFPFLIDKATMTLARSQEVLDFTPEEGAGETNPYKVWDGGVKNYGDTETPTLEFENESYITVFSQLKKNAKDYPLSWAAEKTHLEASRIEQMTREFALDKPSVLSMGWGGPDKWYNADVTGHCAAVLSALVGIIGMKGGGAGGYPQWQVTYGCEFGEWPEPDDWGPSDGTEGNFERRDEDAGVHGVVALGDAFLMHYANTERTVEWLKSLDFVMVCDIYHTMSVDYADIVLPACSKFELNEDIGSLKTARDYVELQQKVIDPLFESKPDYEIEYGLAKALGVADALPSTRRELVETMLDSEDPALAGITIDSLLANRCLQRLDVPEEYPTEFEDHVFPSQSGRMELYYDMWKDDGQQLPAYEDPNEAYEDNPALSQYPLQLTQARSKFFIHNQFVDAKWIQQYYMTTLELNPQDAEERGIESDDVIRGFNDRGEFKCKARINAAVRPGTARTYEGQWPRFMEEGPVQNVTNDSRNERSIILNAAPVAPFNDTLIQVEKA